MSSTAWARSRRRPARREPKWRRARPPSTRLGLPYLVADDGDVVGYAYAAPFRTRAAYRFTVEDSVYVAPGQSGRAASARRWSRG